MSTTFCLSIDFSTTVCSECGGVYALTTSYENKRKNDGKRWNCPYCQTSYGYSKSEVAKLKEQLAKKERELEREATRHNWTKSELQDTEHRRRAEKAAKTRIKNRVAVGVCPCCKRTFKQLAAHMKTKHPSYGGKTTEETKTWQE